MNCEPGDASDKGPLVITDVSPPRRDEGITPCQWQKSPVFTQTPDF